MDLQPIFDLAEICHQKGIKHAIISPGSRNAALTIAFVRHPKIKCYSVPDERSAAFVALGMSLKTKLPTVIICTSGSAALNYAPAVSEAFFNQVPMLILTADRPPEWIGQRDGQTIFQEAVYGKHVKKSYVFPSLDNTGNFDPGHQMAIDAIDCCLSENKGPVHINIPFREPFYPEENDKYLYNKSLNIQLSDSEEPKFFAEISNELADSNRILIIAGQDARDENIISTLSELSSKHQIPVIADIISNVHQVEGAITKQDLFLKNYTNESLRPDLLITIGMSVISKNLKLYLRKNKPHAHWHVRNEPEVPDTYKSLTKHIKVDSQTFLNHFLTVHEINAQQTEYFDQWQTVNLNADKAVSSCDSIPFSDFIAYRKVLESLPNKSDLHLANSMAVRYANMVGLAPSRSIEVFCNRGTSGIDGSNSTALGSALMTSRPTFLLTGDMAFLYDRNAFWHNHIPDNLFIVVFNNHGGGIFRMIDGPSRQPEFEEFFETRQNDDSRSLANSYGFEYFECRNMNDLISSLPHFVNGKGRKIMEIFTNAEESKKAYKTLFTKIQN